MKASVIRLLKLIETKDIKKEQRESITIRGCNVNSCHVSALGYGHTFCFSWHFSLRTFNSISIVHSIIKILLYSTKTGQSRCPLQEHIWRFQFQWLIAEILSYCFLPSTLLNRIWIEVNLLSQLSNHYRFCRVGGCNNKWAKVNL